MWCNRCQQVYYEFDHDKFCVAYRPTDPNHLPLTEEDKQFLKDCGIKVEKTAWET
jgi:hypothetical protein